MKIGYLIFLVFYGLPLFASEFSSFQVDEVKLQQLYQKQDKVKELPKGLVFSQGIVPVSNSPQDIQFEKSPLYEQVMEYMEKYHQEIGQELIGNTLNRSKDFNLGVKNMSGFTWQKPLGVVSVIADRQVIPSTTNSKWEVHDLILFSVNAKTFLESLSDQGAIRIEQAQLKAFAGLSFNRQYEYIHSVSSYEEGISLDSSKLFLSPAVFHGALYQAMWPGDSISKKDYFSIHAGGAVHLPIYKGLDLSAAVLGGVEKISETKLSLNETNSSVYRDFDLILKFNNKTNAFFGAEANLALDFFNLLKITLLKFEYQFSYEKSLTSVYRFPVSELIQYELNGIEHKKLIGAVNSNSIEDEFVARHLDHYEESRLKTHDFDFYFFLWGINSTSSEEELIWRSKDKESHFYSSQREKSSHTKTLKGSVTGVLSLSILGVDLFKDYKKSTTHAYDLNYTNVDENKISTLTFRKEYYLQKTNGWGGKRNKKSFIKSISNINVDAKEVMNSFKKNKIKAPIEAQVEYSIGTGGFVFFSQLDQRSINQMTEFLCEDQSDESYIYESTCESKVLNLYSKVKQKNDRQIYNYNKLLKEFYDKSISFTLLETLFGQENVSSKVKVRAITYDDQPFTFYKNKGFSSGGW